MTSSCPNPPDMGDCKKRKKRCLSGPCVGFAYTAGEECSSGYSFDPDSCQCQPPVSLESGTWRVTVTELSYRTNSTTCAVFEVFPYFDSQGNFFTVGYVQDNQEGSAGPLDDLQPQGTGEGVSQCDTTSGKVILYQAETRSATIAVNDPDGYCYDNFGNYRPDRSAGTIRGAVSLRNIKNNECYTSPNIPLGPAVPRASCGDTSGNGVPGLFQITFNFEYLGPEGMGHYYPGLTPSSSVGGYRVVDCGQ